MLPAMNSYIGSTKFKQQKEPVIGYKRAIIRLQDLGSGIIDVGLHAVQGPDGLKQVHFNASSLCPSNDKHNASPKKWCKCGFYSYFDLTKAYNHFNEHKHLTKQTVLIKTVSSGQMVMYTEGVRAGRQRVVEILVDKCYSTDCGKYADRMCVLTKDSNWLSGVCASHASGRYGKLYSFSEIQKQINASLTEGEPDITVKSFNDKVKPWTGEFDIFKRQEFPINVTAAVLSSFATGLVISRLLNR